jgi:hypothetical protein
MNFKHGSEFLFFKNSVSLIFQFKTICLISRIEAKMTSKLTCYFARQTIVGYYETLMSSCQFVTLQCKSDTQKSIYLLVD